MQRTVKINFPDDFEFPEKVNETGEINGKDMFDICENCPLFYCDTYEPIFYCMAHRGDEKVYPCPFYGKSEDEVIEM